MKLEKLKLSSFIDSIKTEMSSGKSHIEICNDSDISELEFEFLISEESRHFNSEVQIAYARGKTAIRSYILKNMNLIDEHQTTQKTLYLTTLYNIYFNENEKGSQILFIANGNIEKTNLHLGDRINTGNNFEHNISTIEGIEGDLSVTMNLNNSKFVSPKTVTFFQALKNQFFNYIGHKEVIDKENSKIKSKDTDGINTTIKK